MTTSQIIDVVTISLSVLGVSSGSYAFFASGSWVKLEAYLAIHNGDSILKVSSRDLDEFPFEFLNHMSNPVLIVRARNIGRSPMSVEALELENQAGKALPFTGIGMVGTRLPKNLAPGTSEYWAFDLVDCIKLSEIQQASDSRGTVRARVALASNGIKVSRPISQKQLIEYRELWKAARLRLH